MLIADILPSLIVDVPTCPDFTAKSALVRAAIELCVHSSAWNEVQDPITLIDGVSVYDIEAPPDAAVSLIMEVSVGSNQVLPTTILQVRDLMPDWQTAVGNRPLHYAAPTGGSTVRVFPIPKDSNRARMTLRVAYQPTLTAASLPDFLVNKHLDTLLCGARSRLFMMPKKDWSDPKLADYNKQQFDADKTDLRIVVLHGEVPSQLTVRARRFGF